MAASIVDPIDSGSNAGDDAKSSAREVHLMCQPFVAIVFDVRTRVLHILQRKHDANSFLPALLKKG